MLAIAKNRYISYIFIFHAKKNTFHRSLKFLTDVIQFYSQNKTKADHLNISKFEYLFFVNVFNMILMRFCFGLLFFVVVIFLTHQNKSMN